MDETRLREIEERAGRATPGPWSVQPSDDGREMHVVADDPGNPDWPWFLATLTGHTPGEEHDGPFIAHARSDVPALVEAVRARDAEIAKQGAEIARLREALEEVVTCGPNDPCETATRHGPHRIGAGHVRRLVRVLGDSR
jgi:hypothetical protein